MIGLRGVYFGYMAIFMFASAMNSKFVFPSLIAAAFVLVRPDYFYRVLPPPGGYVITNFGWMFLLVWLASLLATFARR